MKYFFDTSALVKLYSDEDGSDKVRKIIMNPLSENYILELAICFIRQKPTSGS